MVYSSWPVTHGSYVKDLTVISDLMLSHDEAFLGILTV